MAVEQYKFLDETGVKQLSTKLLTKVNTRIAGRIAPAVTTQNSTDDYVLSVKGLMALLGTSEADGTGTTIEDRLINLASDINDLDGDINALDTKVDGLTHLTYETIVGNIEDIQNPSETKIYLQKDDEDDPTYVMYKYCPPEEEGEDGTWIAIGDTSIKLIDYWSRDDIDSMREALSIHDAQSIAEATITSRVEEAFGDSDPFPPATPPGV